jgi:hypothetical protein
VGPVRRSRSWSCAHRVRPRRNKGSRQRGYLMPWGDANSQDYTAWHSSRDRRSRARAKTTATYQHRPRRGALRRP